MWISGWSIDDFGHLHGMDIEGLTGGVNVVLGPNESGKTTTLHFLRWVLFGFPRGNTLALRRYRPGSTVIGGRVHVVHHDRSISVQRHYGDERPGLSAADGTALGGAIWHDVVGTAGRELFETVFAITTDELDSFAELNTDEVREHIYAAGIMGHGPSAREALEKLESMRSALLKPKSGQVRVLLRDLDRCTEALCSATAEAVSLDRRRDDLQQLRTIADQCDQHRRRLDADMAHLEDLIASWPSWSEAMELQESLSEMPDKLELPVDPIGKLDSLNRSVALATRELADAEDALRANAEQIDAVGTDDRLLRLVAPAEELDRASALVAKQETRLIELASTEEQRAKQLADALNDLGADWSIERAAEVDVSLPAVQRARELARNTSDVEAQVERASAALQQTEAAITATRRTISSLEARCTDIRSQNGPVHDTRSARFAAQHLMTLIPELEARRNAESDHARWEALAREMQSANPKPGIPGSAVPTLVALAVVCVLAAGISLITGAPLPAVGFVLVSGLAGWLALALHRHRATTTAGAGTRSAGSLRTASADASRAPGTDVAPGDETRSSSEIASELQTVAASAGFTTRPTIEAANQRFDDLNRLATLDRQLEEQREQAELESELLRTATEAHDQALASSNLVALQWTSWRDEAGLHPELHPGDCVEFLDRVRNVRSAAEDHVATVRTIENTAREIVQYRKSVSGLLMQAGFDPADSGSTLQALLAAVRRDAERRRRVTELQLVRPALARAEGRAKAKLAHLQEELDILMAGAGVGDDEGFRRVAEREDSRGRSIARLTQIDIELKARFGNEDAVDAARAELATGDVERWRQSSRDLVTLQQEALAAYEQAIDDYRVEKDAIAGAEISADVAGLSLNVEALRSELREAMDDWTVATLAQKGIDDTLGRFETERQPEVVRSAAESFRRITDGHYANLVPEDGALIVLEPGGNRLDSSQLSRGTTEQLYLAMRFALARHYARSTPLPLVLDDVLVNADPRRKRRLANELHEVANDLQVLLFTCHPETAGLLADLGAEGSRGANIVEMPQ